MEQEDDRRSKKTIGGVRRQCKEQEINRRSKETIVGARRR